MDAKTILSNKWVWLAGLGIVGLVIYLKSRAPSAEEQGITVTTSFNPASVGSNELVSADKYRLIGARRSGMSYTKISGTLGGSLEFASPASGKFTWNVIQEGGQLYAEIAPS